MISFRDYCDSADIKIQEFQMFSKLACDKHKTSLEKSLPVFR